ncbi:Hypothetical predicted protein [Paramuricea clavata]|uniref:Uncharacterized protein n=1 Tax=Paramuricea clavata TaxID=317549 RepID=A0A6S7FIV4_PARCT|nr:Hypothetical predicted protein [Paramuricea clavata]
MGDDVKRLALIDANKYNTMMQTIEKLVSDKKILGDAKQTAAEGELIEGHATMVDSVKRNAPYATDDIINYVKKRKNYLKEKKEPAAAADDDGDEGDNPRRSALKPGSLARSEFLIRGHLKKVGVVETHKGVKFGGKTLPIAYDDMIADLTKNVKKTNTNLTSDQHTKLLKELKKTHMPVTYIRSEHLRNQYREIGGSDTPTTSRQEPPPPPLTYSSPRGPLMFSGRRKGSVRGYMFDT